MDRVIGLGLPKTGTKTLKFALMELGFDKPKKCKQKFTCLYRDRKYDKLYEIARKANNISDSPWCLMYRQLEAWWPDAYFILTVRKGSGHWYQSVMRHIATRGMSALNFKNVFNMEIGKINPTRLKDFYEHHNQRVWEYFDDNPKYMELCWEDGDGWEKLCSFLNKPIPKKKFPWENKSKK